MNATPVAPAAQPADAEKLARTINWIDSLAQEGCDRIQSTGRILLVAMQCPDLYLHAGIADVAVVVRSMVDYASELANNINSNAESVGANHIEPEGISERTVVDAWRAAAKIEERGAAHE